MNWIPSFVCEESLSYFTTFPLENGPPSFSKSYYRAIYLSFNFFKNLRGIIPREAFVDSL